MENELIKQAKALISCSDIRIINDDYMNNHLLHFKPIKDIIIDKIIKPIIDIKIIMDIFTILLLFFYKIEENIIENFYVTLCRVDITNKISSVVDNTNNFKKVNINLSG